MHVDIFVCKKCTLVSVCLFCLSVCYRPNFYGFIPEVNALID